MNATVHWTIFDGLDGFPNIIAELNWSEQSGRSYEDVIMAHAAQKLSDKSFGMTISRIALSYKGKIGDTPYRDFLVTYKVKRHLQGSSLLKVSRLESGHPDDANEQPVTKIIRVFHHSNAGGPVTATQKEERKLKAATILAKIAQRQECSIDTAYRLTEALKAERLLHRKLFVRFKPLLRSFDVVDFDYTQDGDIGNIGFAHDIADIAELFEVLPEINQGNIQVGYIVSIGRRDRVEVIGKGPKNISYKILTGGAAGMTLTAAYAEITEIVQAAKREAEKHPFEVGERFTAQRVTYDDPHSHKSTVTAVEYEIVKATDTTIRLKEVGTDSKPITRKPRKRWNGAWMFSIDSWHGNTFYKEGGTA